MLPNNLEQLAQDMSPEVSNVIHAHDPVLPARARRWVWPVLSRRNAVALLFGAFCSTAALVISLTAQAPTRPSQQGVIEAETSTTPTAGPQPGIMCPADAVNLAPGAEIQRVIDTHPAATTFCFKAGVHPITKPITPKSGHTFVGEYGAILDGTGWSTTDPDAGAFRAHNQDINDVTIRNLVIRRMPKKGIHAFKDFSHRWIIEYNEIAFNKTGLVFPNDSIIRNNHIHHNVDNSSSSNPAERGGGYVGYYARNSILDSNEIAYNGMEQKVMESVDVTFRNNFVHHNVGDGIWYDGGNPGALIEDNRVEDNARNGIFYEASNGGIIRNNTVRRSGDTGVFISTSQNAQIYNNTLEGNFRGITYFVNCGAMGDDSRPDLKNNLGAEQHYSTWHAGRRVRQRLRLHCGLHTHTVGAVSERLEEPDIFQQHVPRAITHWRVLALGRTDAMVSVAVTWARPRRRHRSVAPEGTCSAAPSATPFLGLLGGFCLDWGQTFSSRETDKRGYLPFHP